MVSPPIERLIALSSTHLVAGDWLGRSHWAEVVDPQVPVQQIGNLDLPEVISGGQRGAKLRRQSALGLPLIKSTADRVKTCD